MNLRISILLFSTMFAILASGQRKITLPKPMEYKIDAPYKGEKFRYHTFNYNIYSNFHVNGFGTISIDKNGRFWGCSQQSGFCSFDGVSLFTYGSVNGFYDRFKTIVSDNQGRTWIGGNGVGVVSPSKGLSLDWYIDIGKTISDAHIRSIDTDSKGNVYVSTAFGGISYITPDSTYFFNSQTCNLPDVRFGSTAIDGKDRFWFHDPKNNDFYYIENMKISKWDLHKERDIVFVNISNSPGEELIAWDNEDNVYQITVNDIVPFKIEYPEKKIKEIKWFKYNPTGQAYFGNRTQIFKLVNGKAQLIIDTKNKGLEFQSVAFDGNGGIWFTSPKGVYYIPSQNILHFEAKRIRGVHPSLQLYQNDTGELMSLKIDKDRTIHLNQLFKDDFAKGENLEEIIECPHGYIIKDKNQQRRFINLNGQLGEVPDIYKNFAGHQVFVGTHLFWNKDEELIFFNDQNEIERTGVIGAHHKLFYKKTDGTHYFLSDSLDKKSFRIWTYKDGETKTIMKDLLNDTLRIEGAHYINDTTFLLATWGYYMVKLTPNTSTFKTRGFGTNILYTADNDYLGNFWTGGIEGGLNYVDGQTDSVININQKDGLKGGKVSNFYISKNNDLVITTIVGVAHLSLIDPDLAVHSREDFFNKYRLEFFDSQSGLMGGGFGHPVLDDHGRVWTTNRLGEWQLIFGEDSTIGPKHLRFESIQSIDQKNSKKYFQFWLPGTAYKVNENIEINYNEDLLVNLKAIYFRDIFGLNYQYKIDKRAWSVPQNSPTFQLSGLNNGEHNILFRAISPDNKKSNEVSMTVSVIPPFYETSWFIILMIFLVGVIIYLIFRWRLHVLKERQKQLEQTVEERTEEIRVQKIEIETQHSEIRDSIAYAKRIQEAILPPTALVNRCLPHNFILYKPKDVVAGDFYWLEEVGDTIIFAAADCTGHGVPGAMVSVVCHNALNRSVREFGLTEPNAILDKTRELVLQRFESGKREVNDGMDIAVCALNTKTKELHFSGANNGLYLIRDGELLETKGDKQPIGKFHDPKPFTNHRVQLQKHDTFYVYTDGFADQFGGDKGKKLKSSHFKKLLVDKHKLDLKEQLQDISNAFETWKGELEQVDDVCVIGVRI